MHAYTTAKVSLEGDIGFGTSNNFSSSIPRRGIPMADVPAPHFEGRLPRHIFAEPSAPLAGLLPRGFDPNCASMSLTSDLGFVGDFRPTPMKPRSLGILPSDIDLKKVKVVAEVGFTSQPSMSESSRASHPASLHFSALMCQHPLYARMAYPSTTSIMAFLNSHVHIHTHRYT
jgi:hypothetical protein